MDDTHINEKKAEKYASAVRSTKKIFDQTQHCKLRVILRSQVLRGVYTLVKDTGR